MASFRWIPSASRPQNFAQNFEVGAACNVAVLSRRTAATMLALMVAIGCAHQVEQQVSCEEPHPLAHDPIQANDRAIEELPGALRKRAQLLLEHKRFAEAEFALGQLIEQFAEFEHAREHVVWSAIMLFDVLAGQVSRAERPSDISKANDALEAWWTRLQNMPMRDWPELEPLRPRVLDLLVAAAWRRATFIVSSADYGKCAAEFLDLNERFPEHSDADIMLWNAADCLDADFRSGEAVQVRELLLERHPTSKHAVDTRFLLAESLRAIAQYEDAARNYELVAEDHPTLYSADDALENAYLLRLGLGQIEQAQADLRRFERLYKRKDIHRAARLFWTQHHVLDTNTARRNHAIEYLKAYGSKGGVDRAVVAEALIGQIDWRRSCEEPLLHDACVWIRRRFYTSHHHGSPVPARLCKIEAGAFVSVHRRGTKLSASAQARFDRVLALAPKVELPIDDPERDAAFRQAWGMAMVYKIDRDYEKHLQLEIPADLSRLEKFIEIQTRRAEDLRTRYAKVDQTGSSKWMLAAVARTAAFQQLVAYQLFRASVPQALTTREEERAYCEALAEQARPFRDRAIVAYQTCLERSTEYQYAGEFSRMCAEELEELDRTVSLVDRELFGGPVFNTGGLERTGVLAEP